MITTYTAMKRLVPNAKTEIIERDDAGNIVGTWFGFWNFKRHTVTLYPNRTHPFFKFSGVPKPKVVSDLYVRVQRPPEEKKPPQKTESEYYSSYAIKRMPVSGQIEIKF